ncbi:IS3 family transposase [Saccharopolyspora shandongensis]|uniref:IS3 family transposase n=1 Tax=Saccharopolyspora shandongensis TaxID=418495 RepID=UPI0033FB4C23
MTTFVDIHRDRFGVEPVCVVVGLSVSTYYASKRRQDVPSPRAVRDAELAGAIGRVWEEKGKGLYGARKVRKQLRRDGVDVARCTVERLMRAAGLAGAAAGRSRPRTTIPGDAADRPDDLVERDFTGPEPNRLWVTDLTYVRLATGGFCYTAFVTDAFSRAIVGWQVADNLCTELALDALEWRSGRGNPVCRTVLCITVIAAPRADSTGRRNTSIREVLNGATAGLGGGCDGKGCDAFAGPSSGGAA